MLEKIRYINGYGEELIFGADGLYINENDLRDWEWSYETTHGRVCNFSRKPITRKLPIKVWAETPGQAAGLKNMLHDVAHVDINAGTPGRLYVGDCYLECYLIASSKSKYLSSACTTDINMTVAADRAVWYKEVETWFGERVGLASAVVDNAIVGYAVVGSDGSEETVDAGPADYPRTYPYGYPNQTIVGDDPVQNDFVVPCDWKIVIQGPAVNPAIEIGGEVHRVLYSVGEGETIEIDSRSRTITARKTTGDVNIFRYRDKDADIFAKIRPGSHAVAWNGDYIFTVTLYGERSEPLWT